MGGPQRLGEGDNKDCTRSQRPNSNQPSGGFDRDHSGGAESSRLCHLCRRVEAKHTGGREPLQIGVVTGNALDQEPVGPRKDNAFDGVELQKRLQRLAKLYRSSHAAHPRPVRHQYSGESPTSRA